MRNRHPGVRAAVGAVLVTAALGAAACSDANEVADLTTVAPPVSPTVSDDPAPAPTAPAAPASTGASTADTATPGTSAGASTTTPGVASSASSVPVTSDDDGLTGPTFSDALGVRVDTAPGVRTRGDTRRLLDEGLYVHIAWEADPDDPSVFTVQPDDVEILEAYANAVTVYYRAATTTRTTDDPDFARYYTDEGAKFETSFQQARDEGFVLSLGSGVVLRPYIPADQRTPTSAIILDCYLQNQQYLLPTDSRPPGQLTTSPTIASMTLVDGQWKIDRSATEPAACL